MSIRIKLLFLALGTQILLVLSLGLFALITAPADQLQAENAAFQTAANAAARLEGEANKLATAGLIGQIDVYLAALKDYEAAVGRLADLKALAAANPTLADALQAVARLKAGATAPFQKITASAQALVADVDELGINRSSDPTLNTLVAASFGTTRGTEASRAKAQFHATNLLRDLRNGNDSLGATIEVITTKNAVVAQQVAAIRTQSFWTAAGVIVVTFVASALLALRTASGIASAVKALGATGAALGSGDLTRRFQVRRRDEIGTLGGDLNGMLEALNAALERIQAVAAESRAVRESLQSVIADSTSSATEIDANTESIKRQMERIDAMISADTNAVAEVATTVQEFHRKMDAQNGHVAESAGAVAQMLASIDNINRITEQNRVLSEELLHETDRSQEVFEGTFRTVAEIGESIHAIQDMADVIAGIAGQTNILAMNAAIEAAHAGEYGRGFAVVADEITKLASASAQSSREIGRTIAGIVDRMRTAGDSSSEAMKAFGTVSGRIREVGGSIAAIYSNVNEMHAGSRQILEAMEGLRTASGEMTEESARIGRSTEVVGRSMDDLGRISHEIVASIDEIAVGMRLISTAVHHLTDQSDRMGTLGQDLDVAVAAFKTGGPPPQ